MRFSLGFILLMVVMGGGSAALGDYIGRYVGKRRLNLFRLRPKHTAILFTFLGGFLGTALAIGLVSVVVPPVGKWILEGEQARIELANARKELQGVQGKIVSTNSQLDQTKKDLDAKTVELTEANKQKEEQVAAADKAKQDADEARKNAESAKSEADRVRKEIASTEAKLKETNGKLTEAQSALEKAKQEQQTIANDNKGLNEQNLKLTASNTDLEKKIKNLNTEVESLKANLERLNSEKASAQENLSKTQSALHEAETNLANANQAVRNAEAAASMAEYRTQVLSGKPRFFPMSVRARDELARTVVPPRSKPETVRERISALMSDATRYLRSRDGDPQSIVSAKMIEVKGSGESLITVDAQVDQIARVASSNPEPTLLVARSFVNTFQGEDAIVVLEAVSNRLVYIPGQVVFEGRVDGSQSKSQIVDALSRLILDGLRPKVIQDGLVPATGHDSELGEITSDQIISIADQLKAYGRNARVQFLSKAATRRSDKLNLEYRLKP